MYSGVPKAGAPDFMSTFEVKVPMAQAQPGATHWKSATADSASAIDCATAPAIVTGAMAPASVKGVTITACPRRISRRQPSIIGWSCLSGEVELMLVYIRGVARNSSSDEPARDADHLHHVLDPLLAERIGVHHLVGDA